MLPTINRITKDKEYGEVFKFGRSSFDAIMGVKALSKELAANKYGIIVSTKVSKKAIDRNKIKRQIREIIHSRLEEIAQGYEVIIIILPKTKEKKYDEIKDSLIKHFIKLKLLKK